MKFPNQTKILVVEDDQFLGGLLVKQLTSEGAVVTHVASGEGVLAAVEKDMPAIMILDVLLPGIDGFNVLSQIRANDKLKDLPVIFLTNMQSEADLEKGKKLGAKSFLIKSMVTIDEIVKEVVDTLAKMGVK